MATAANELGPMARKILDHLKRTDGITNMESQGLYKCRALPRRIADLEQAGYGIRRVWKRDVTGQRYMRYFLTTGSEKVAA